MRCTQAEKLIPLFVGDDLPSERTVEMRVHLESCARCRQLAAEFEESRNWMSSFAAPNFDEATLDGVRNLVLNEIGRIEKRPGLLEWILPAWNSRFAFAASMALLLLAVASAFLFYRQQKGPSPKSGPVAIENNNPAGQPESKQTIAPHSRQQSDNSRVVKRSPKSYKSTGKAPTTKTNLNESPQFEIQPVEPDLIAQAPTTTEPPTAQPIDIQSSNNDLAENENMLRIEIQTADPNIRIIWFAPKDITTNTKN